MVNETILDDDDERDTKDGWSVKVIERVIKLARKSRTKKLIMATKHLLQKDAGGSDKENEVQVAAQVSREYVRRVATWRQRSSKYKSIADTDEVDVNRVANLFEKQRWSDKSEATAWFYQAQKRQMNRKEKMTWGEFNDSLSEIMKEADKVLELVMVVDRMLTYLQAYSYVDKNDDDSVNIRMFKQVFRRAKIGKRIYRSFLINTLDLSIAEKMNFKEGDMDDEKEKEVIPFQRFVAAFEKDFHSTITKRASFSTLSRGPSLSTGIQLPINPNSSFSALKANGSNGSMSSSFPSGTSNSDVKKKKGGLVRRPSAMKLVDDREKARKERLARIQADKRAIEEEERQEKLAMSRAGSLSQLSGTRASVSTGKNSFNFNSSDLNEGSESAAGSPRGGDGSRQNSAFKVRKFTSKRAIFKKDAPVVPHFNKTDKAKAQTATMKKGEKDLLIARAVLSTNGGSNLNDIDQRLTHIQASGKTKSSADWLAQKQKEDKEKEQREKRIEKERKNASKKPRKLSRKMSRSAKSPREKQEMSEAMKWMTKSQSSKQATTK